jgi:hypothetical protein
MTCTVELDSAPALRRIVRATGRIATHRVHARQDMGFSPRDLSQMHLICDDRPTGAHFRRLSARQITSCKSPAVRRCGNQVTE